MAIILYMTAICVFTILNLCQLFIPDVLAHSSVAFGGPANSDRDSVLGVLTVMLIYLLKQH